MFTLRIDTLIDIHAPVDEVWHHLTDFSRYPQWNPMLDSVKGEPRLGEPVKFRVNMPDRPVHLRAKINRCHENRELRWAGGIPTLLRGEHYFALEELAGNKVRFYHGETFSGLLLPLLQRKLARVGPPLYESMNNALKQRLEEKL